MMFENREDAGRRLGELLQRRGFGAHLVVVGLPRGGVPVAAQVAKMLDAPLDVIGVRKLGVPAQPELAMGAVGEAGAVVLDDDIVRRAGVTDDRLAAVERRARVELGERLRQIRDAHPARDLRGRTVVIVDDGIATGATARAACRVAAAQGADRIVLATPVAPDDWAKRLAGAADEFVAVATPHRFRAVGNHYADFSQTSEAEVLALLGADRAARGA